MFEGLVVLAVDDEPDMGEIVRRVLGRHGANVHTATGLTGARKLCQEHGSAIDLVVTDLRLDDGNGAQVAQVVRQTQPSAVVVYMSGLPYFDTSVQELGGDAAVVTKPFKPSELVEVVREALAKAGR